MIKHEEIVYINQDEFDRVNRLLAIPSLEDMTYEEMQHAGAAVDTCEGLYFVEFDDGSSMNIDLCSGTHNYWDDVVWTNADGSTDVVLDCAYELDDIEFEADGELYIVRFVKE